MAFWRMTVVWAGIGLAGCGVDQVRSVQAPAEPPPALAETVPPTAAPTAPAERPGGPIPIRAAAPGAPAAAPRIVELVPGAGPAIGQPAPPPAPRPSGDITLRFDQTDVREVVAVVLRDLLNVSYLIDPEVTGPVTLSTGRPLTRDQLLPVLEATLNTRGATLLEAGGIYRVVAQRDAPGPGQVPRVVGPGSGPEAGFALQVFPLAYIAPTEMQKILEPVLPRGRIVGANDARGVLLVAGTPAELTTARDTVRIFDIDQMAAMTVLLVSLDNADATTLVPELNNIFAAATKAGDGGQIRFMPVERLNAVLAMSRQRRYVEEAHAWIMRLDRTRNANEVQLYVHHVQHGKAAEVARTLRGIFGGETAEEPAGREAAPRVAGLPTIAERLGYQSSEPGLNPLRVQGAPPQVSRPEALTRPQALPAEEGQQPGQPLVDPSLRRDRTPIRVRADEATNSVLISATPRDYALIQQVLQQLDIAPLQVLIEATIFEVELINSLRYGVQYFIKAGGLGGTDSSRTILTRDTTQSSSISPPVPGFSFSLLGGMGDARLIIDLLSNLTQLNVISSPQLLVLDNQVARLQVGDVVPIVTQTASSTLTDNPLIVNSVQYRETGVTLEVTPRVNTNGLVTLDINQTVSDVVRTTTSGIDSPTIRQRRILSSVAAQSGSTILLGGQIRESNTRGTDGIPFLHELPIIGPLFGSKNSDVRRTELLVLLTPRVIRNQDEARDATLEMRRKFQSVLNYEQGAIRVPRPVR